MTAVLFTDLRLRTPGGVFARSPTFQSEVINAYEAGYRARNDLNGRTYGGEVTANYDCSVRSFLNLRRDIEVDAIARFVDALPNPAVPRHLELDSGFPWPGADVELGVVGRNLIDAAHPEFGAQTPFRNEVRRNIYAFLNFRF